MDKIELTSQQVEAVLAWRDRYPDLVRSAPAPLKAVEIMIVDTGYRIKGIRDGDRLSLTCFHGYNKLIDFRAGIESTGLMRSRKKQMADGMTEENLKSVITIYASVMALMTFGVRYREEPKERKTQKASQKARKSSQKRPTKRITYILRTVGNDVTLAPAGSHASPSGIFTVRGHYRHYKNGKVIWIATYKKGTGKKKSKTYKMGGNNDV